MIGMAMYYVGSTADTPTQTALTYVRRAQTALEEAVAELDNYLNGEVAAFSRSLSEAGIGLFTDATQP